MKETKKDRILRQMKAIGSSRWTELSCKSEKPYPYVSDEAFEDELKLVEWENELEAKKTKKKILKKMKKENVLKELKKNLEKAMPETKVWSFPPADDEDPFNFADEENDEAEEKEKVEEVFNSPPPLKDSDFNFG